MSRNNEQGFRRRWANFLPLRNRILPSRIIEPSVNPEATAANPPSSASGLFEAANNVGIYGGSMIAAGGNVTIINERRTLSQNDGGEIPGDHITVEAESTIFRREPNVPPQREISEQRSCNIYYRSLIGKRRGSPLWLPEPSYNLPVDYQRAGVSIGDVGVLLASGSFNYFFNICFPSDHPINQGNVPGGFVPLDPPLSGFDIQFTREFYANSYVTSESIEISHRQYSNSPITDLLFESKAEEGAILTMPHGAYSQDVINTIRFRSYVARHIESWYRYIIGVRGCEVQNGDIRLVIGSDKTDLWGMAAFVKSSETVRLKFQPIRQGETYRWEYSGSFDTRTGPDPEIINHLRINNMQAIHNQCLFARTLNANLRQDIWKRIVGEIYTEMGLDPEDAFAEGSHYSSAIFHPSSAATGSNHGNEAPSSQTPNVSMRMMRHPSNLLNGLLWNHLRPAQEVKTIITTDTDWISVIRPDDLVLPTSGILYERIMSKRPLVVTDSIDDYMSLDFRSDDDPHSFPTVPPVDYETTVDIEDVPSIGNVPLSDNPGRDGDADLPKNPNLGMEEGENWPQPSSIPQSDTPKNTDNGVIEQANTLIWPNVTFPQSDSTGPIGHKKYTPQDLSTVQELGYEHANSSTRRIYRPGGTISRTPSRQSLSDRTNVHIESHPESFPPEEELPPTESRRQRIEREAQRRQELNEGYFSLKEVLPSSLLKMSKVSLLERAVSRIQVLEQENKTLRARLARAEQEYRDQLHKTS